MVETLTPSYCFNDITRLPQENLSCFHTQVDAIKATIDVKNASKQSHCGENEWHSNLLQTASVLWLAGCI